MSTTTSGQETEPVAQPNERREIRQIVWRSLLLQGGFNFERFQNLGLWWILRPFLDRMYKEPGERAAAYKRHLAYFNTHPWLVTPILGVIIGMERRRAEGGAEQMDDETINSVKVGMMAPLAGIGDSLAFGTARPIVAGACAALAVNGNIAGPIIFFVAMIVIQFAARIWGASVGYRQGARFFEKLDPTQLDRVKTGATMVGLAVTGALVATLLKVGTPLAYHNGDATVKLQDSLDQVLPALLPLAATLGVFLLVRRRISSMLVLIGVAIVGLIGGFFGVLS